MYMESIIIVTTSPTNSPTNMYNYEIPLAPPITTTNSKLLLHYINLFINNSAKSTCTTSFQTTFPFYGASIKSANLFIPQISVPTFCFYGTSTISLASQHGYITPTSTTYILQITNNFLPPPTLSSSVICFFFSKII